MEVESGIKGRESAYIKRFYVGLLGIENSRCSSPSGGKSRARHAIAPKCSVEM